MTLLSATKEFFPKITPGKIMVFSSIKLFSQCIGLLNLENFCNHQND